MIRHSNDTDGESKESGNNKAIKYILGFIAGLGILAGVYFGGYIPQHRALNSIRHELIITRKALGSTVVQRDSLETRVAVAGSAIAAKDKKIGYQTRQIRELKDEIHSSAAIRDSTINYMVLLQTELQDSLSELSKRLSFNNTYITSLERELKEKEQKAKALFDSTYALSAREKEYIRVIGEKDERIDKLTPPSLNLLNNTTFGVAAQTSRQEVSQGYGFVITTDVVKITNFSEVRARGDFTINLDNDATYKNFGLDISAGDAGGRYRVDFGGGANLKKPNVGDSMARGYIGAGVGFDLAWVRGLGLDFYVRGIKNEPPTLQTSIRFCRK